jgi:thioredoxin 1
MSEKDSIEEIKQKKMQEMQETEQGGGDATAPGEPIHVDGKADLSDAVDSYDVVLADFYADWCGPCKMIEPIVKEIAAETDAAVAKVDVDVNQQLAGEYGVQGVPTLVLFADGEAARKLVGVQDKDSLVELVEQHS